MSTRIPFVSPFGADRHRTLCWAMQAGIMLLCSMYICSPSQRLSADISRYRYGFF